MGLRGFTRRLQRNGAWFSRLALGEPGITPVYPVLHITPGPEPSGTAEKGDLYVDEDGNLMIHNGTAWVAAGSQTTPA
jgi:hypothetical protein